MATVPSPKTWEQDYLVNANDLNSQVRDGFEFFYANAIRPFCVLTRTGTLDTVNSVGWKLMSWNLATNDDDNMFDDDADATAIIIRTPGLYDIRAQFFCLGSGSSAAVGTRAVVINKVPGGDDDLEYSLSFGGAAASNCDPPNNPGASPVSHATWDTVCRTQVWEPLAAGDKIRMYVRQDSGSTQSIVTAGFGGNQTYFSARWIAAS